MRESDELGEWDRVLFFVPLLHRVGYCLDLHDSKQNADDDGIRFNDFNGDAEHTYVAYD